MIRRPPRSTLFPYRRSSDLPMRFCPWCGRAQTWRYDDFQNVCPHCDRGVDDWMATRSEEHTSELQSLAYLVCRLLLEKKKRKYTRPDHVLNVFHQPNIIPTR